MAELILYRHCNNSINFTITHCGHRVLSCHESARYYLRRCSSKFIVTESDTDPIAPSAISTRGDLRHTLNTLQLMPRLGTQLSRTYDGAQISHRLAANVARNTSPTSSDRTSSPASRSRSYEAPTPERSKALRRPMKLHFFAGDQGRQASPSRTSNGEVRGDAYAESEEEDEEKGPAFLVFEHEGLVTVKDKQVTTLKPANTGHERSTVEPRESMSIQ